MKKVTVTGVIPPEANQEDTFSAVAPDLLEAFYTDSNIMFFAYGQTGSGKTHTMLGEVDSLSSPELVEGWGLLPRIVHDCLLKMDEWRSVGTQSVLLASAVEFYCMGAHDLSRGGASEVTIDRDANVFGTQSTEIKTTAQLRDWITRMYANRTTAKTKMNDASSRSHVALILTLHQLRADDAYIKTTFSMIDMAGSERHSKTGGERKTGMEAGLEAYRMYMAGTPEKLSIGSQGTLINTELSFIATEILKASDMHRKGMPFRAQKEMSTAASFYFSACFDGRSRLGACVTVTQSPQHGFETWFSLNFAHKLSKCATPLKKIRPISMKRVLSEAKRAAQNALEGFARTNHNPQGAKQARVYSLRLGQKIHTAETRYYLERLVDAQQNGQTPITTTS